MKRLVTLILGGVLLGCSSGGSSGTGNAVLPANPATGVMKTCAKNTASGEECTEQQDLDPYLLLRRMSLDLRGTLPTYEEYVSLEGQTEVPESLVDAWLITDAFRVAMRRYHESLLWPNPRNVILVDGNARLVTSRLVQGEQTITVYSAIGQQRRNAYRGTASVVCGPWLQTDYNPDGSPVAVDVKDPNDPSQVLYRQEGYVRVRPYWNPDTEVNVCAFDAQVAETGSSSECDTIQGTRDPLCGCGPDLRWCMTNDVQQIVWGDMREQFGRAVDQVTTGTLPYPELLTSATIQMNGHLTFWKKHLAQMVGAGRIYNLQGPGDPVLPENSDYTDPTWVSYTRSDAHSGILTLPAYSLRFQTLRARANRFRIVFTGQYFVPPAQPEDPASANCVESTDDLTQMCTCRYCHQVLEPMAASFGKVSEAGSTLISNLPSYDSRCDPQNYGAGQMYPDQETPPRSCERFYAISQEAHNPGWLSIYQYVYLEQSGHNNEGLDDDLHRSSADHLEDGPRGLADQIINDGQLATATVKNLFRHLMGREMILSTTAENSELELLADLADGFQRDYNFPALVKRLVLLPQYRRVR